MFLCEKKRERVTDDFINPYTFSNDQFDLICFYGNRRVHNFGIEMEYRKHFDEEFVVNYSLSNSCDRQWKKNSPGSIKKTSLLNEIQRPSLLSVASWISLLILIKHVLPKIFLFHNHKYKWMRLCCWISTKKREWAKEFSVSSLEWLTWNIQSIGLTDNIDLKQSFESWSMV